MLTRENERSDAPSRSAARSVQAQMMDVNTRENGDPERRAQPQDVGPTHTKAGRAKNLPSPSGGPHLDAAKPLFGEPTDLLKGVGID